MLKNSFLHIPGIGGKTEKKLWNAGMTDWQRFITSTETPLSPVREETARVFIKTSWEHLLGNNPRYFCDLMPAARHWCIFPEFRESAAYIDIETTGLDMEGGDITTIALYDGRNVRYYVNGRNLPDFIRDITRYKVMVTYNGKTFDVPFIENYFGIKLDHAHIDLRYVLKSLGYGGGLKQCERALGIHRGPLDGVDGYFAVLLWYDYLHNGNERALETLLAYNIEDVVNLETLMVKAYNMKIENTPFSVSHRLSPPDMPKMPFRADPLTVERIRRENFSVFRH